ncbi:chitin-binding protein [Pediococcus acidilactici]|nr:chitin-binding protein [Pediococcus acidilactici]UWF34317.1 lytic polysaccharide monooxygenase [Pediococcus acidilactici]
MVKSRNRFIRYVLVVASIVVVVLGLGAIKASAHGFVTNPGGRAYLGSSQFPGKPLNENIGPVMYEPQSIEAPKNTFIDGKIASAGLAKFSQLDEQTADRWYKTPIKSGPLDVTWHLTAPHSTSTWDYYITKPGWDPNKPLKFSDFKKIASFNDHGATPGTEVTHKVTIPDQKGYHVMLSVWNIANTANAFYQVSDVNIQ